MRNKQSQLQMTMNESVLNLLVLLTCLIAGLVVGILIGFGMQITVPPTDVEDTTTTYQPHVVELEGYDIDIAEYVDTDTGVEYLIAIGPIGLAMCPKV